MQSTKSRPLSSYGALAALAAFVVVAAVAPVAAEEAKQAATEAKDRPKEVSVDLGKGIKLELILIPAGEFMMGSPESEAYDVPEEKPQHRVRITKPFYLGKFPVTQEQWEAVMGSNPSGFKSPKNAVENVSWLDCQEFVKKLNAKVRGPKFQLPTEAQWEYACRAGTKTRFYFGDDESKRDDYAWDARKAKGIVLPVGGKKPNAWGLYDMQGNVSQWCADYYDERYYGKSPTDDPPGAVQDFYPRCIRGGSRLSYTSQCRSASRRGMMEVGKNRTVGLRVARVVKEK